MWCLQRPKEIIPSPSPFIRASTAVKLELLDWLGLASPDSWSGTLADSALNVFGQGDVGVNCCKPGVMICGGSNGTRSFDQIDPAGPFEPVDPACSACFAAPGPVGRR